MFVLLTGPRNVLDEPSPHSMFASTIDVPLLGAGVTDAVNVTSVPACGLAFDVLIDTTGCALAEIRIDVPPVEVFPNASTAVTLTATVPPVGSGWRAVLVEPGYVTAGVPSP